MAQVKISQLPVASSLNTTDIFPVVQSGVTKQADLSLLPFIQSGSGAVATDLQTRGRASVKLIDFMTAAQIADAKAGTRSLDCSTATQNAITYCIANNFDLEVPYQVLLSSAVNIDRQVDGAAYDKYFRIWSRTGGGFYTTALSTLFTSSIAFTTAPVSQLVFFDGLNFESDTASTRYVLNDGRFLRTRFDGCTFDKILCVNSTIYTQTMYITNCNMRRGSGTFWTSTSLTLDFKFMGNVVEAWTGNFLSLAQPEGVAIIGNLMEGISGTAIVYNGCQGMSISGNYFEANGKDIDGTGATQANGVILTGNNFAHTNSADYSVIWGTTISGCASIGNYHNGSMHSVAAGQDLLILDTAATSLATNIPSPRFHNKITVQSDGQYVKTNTAAADSVYSVSNTSTTGANLYQVVSTGGTYQVGTENSGASFFGATAYDYVISVPNTRGIALFMGGVGVLVRAGASTVTFPQVGTTASAANAFLDNAASNSLLRSTSSLRYKTNVERLGKDYADAVLQLEPIWYRSLAQADRKDWSWYGLAAEEVAAIDPRLVHWTHRDTKKVTVPAVPDVVQKDGTVIKGRDAFDMDVVDTDSPLVPDSVMYDRVGVLLLDVVKRLDARVKELEAKCG